MWTAAFSPGEPAEELQSSPLRCRYRVKLSKGKPECHAPNMHNMACKMAADFGYEEFYSMGRIKPPLSVMAWAWNWMNCRF